MVVVCVEMLVTKSLRDWHTHIANSLHDVIIEEKSYTWWLKWFSFMDSKVVYDE